jgi:catechol 2,3-dioxygenase-like lactoylglutathione lyase family enzyme
VNIAHVTVPVRDYRRGKEFYERALYPLGVTVLLDWPDRRRAYLGVEGNRAALWLVESAAAGTLEVALEVDAADTVDTFHAAALAAGGHNEHEPGARSEHTRDYAARVRDPDGNSIEALCRDAAGAGALAA